MSEDNPPSKTHRKQEMAALQDLGAELVELSEDRLTQLDLPEFLRDAILEARRVRGFEARRRQMQYVGKLMRKVDAGPIRARVEAWKSPGHAEIARFKRAEAWRERLLHEDGALPELLREHPSARARDMEALVRDARRERERSQPPRRYRELFQALRALLEQRDP